MELSREQQIELVREYCQNNFVSSGMCVDFAIHDTGGGNPHAHIMLTMRPFKDDGTWDDKQKKVYNLDENGIKTRIDHRSHKWQGIKQIPIIHLGSSATQMDKHGIHTEKGDINRQITADNRLLKELRARINRLYSWTNENEHNSDTDFRLDVMNIVLTHSPDDSQY